MKTQSYFTALVAIFIGGTAIAQQGTLDLTFDFDGKVTTALGPSGDGINAIVLQPNGKILVAGYSNNGTNNDFALARYNPDGSQDDSFNSDGKVLTAFSGNDVSRAIALQPDGKIVAAGWTGTGAANDFALARYHADGSLDQSFANNGKTSTPLGTGDDRGYSLLVQPDGKIVIAGYSNNGSKDVFALVRYNTDGSLDNNFGSSGIKTISIGASNDRAFSAALQPDGKIILAGYSNTNVGSDFALARCNPDGSLDSSFGNNGITSTSIGVGVDVANCLFLLPNGKIVAAGYTYVGTTAVFALARYNNDGSLDQSFNIDGIVTTAVGSNGDFANTVLLQADSKIVVVGYSETNGGASSAFALARYNSNGILDNTFNSSGIVTTNLGSARDEAYAAAIQTDGKILVAGRSNNGADFDFALARYQAGSVGVWNGIGNSVNVTLYPNPILGEAVLEYSLSKTEHISIRLFDLQGKVVKTYFDNVIQNIGKHKAIIDLPLFLEPGVYCLVISSSCGIIAMLNVVKPI